MAKISALLIIYNEERHLPEVINQLDFADEIIVVDSFSTDNTLDILDTLPQVTVYKHEFKDYASQRNFAISKANHEWILFLDADERIPKKLKQQILKAVRLDNPKEAYKFKRQYYFNGEKVRFSGTQTNKAHRLFQKGKAHYKPDRLVHEQLVVNGESGVLKHKLKHYFCYKEEQYRNKMISYGKLKGKELYLKGKTCNWFHEYIKPAYKFFNHYIIRLGILDGKKGYTISYMNALSVVHRYKELKRLNKAAPQKQHVL